MLRGCMQIRGPKLRNTCYVTNGSCLSACDINNSQLLRSCCTRQQHAVAQLEEPANNSSATPGSPISSAATMHWFGIELLAAVAGWAATSAGANVPIARNWLRGICPRAEDVQELGRKLSCRAKIYFPGSDEFDAASARWSALGAPKVNVVVVPGTENDVAETVFSSFSIPFSLSPLSSPLLFIVFSSFTECNLSTLNPAVIVAHHSWSR